MFRVPVLTTSKSFLKTVVREVTIKTQVYSCRYKGSSSYGCCKLWLKKRSPVKHILLPELHRKLERNLRCPRPRLYPCTVVSIVRLPFFYVGWEIIISPKSDVLRRIAESMSPNTSVKTELLRKLLFDPK